MFKSKTDTQAAANGAAPKKPARALGLKPLIFMTTLAASLGPLSIFAYFSYKDITNEVTQSVTDRLTRSNTGSARVVRTWVETTEQTIQSMARSDAIVTMDPVYGKAQLVSFNAALPVFYLIHTMGPDGMNVARSDHNKLISYADREYFKAPFNGAPSVIQSAISRTNNKPFFGWGVPIKSDGKTVGVLSALATVEKIADQVTGGKIGVTGYSYLVDTRSSTILAHPDAKLVSTKMSGEIATWLAGGEYGQIRDFVSPVNGQAIKTVATPIGPGMMLVSQIDASEIQGPIQSAKMNTFFFIGLSFVLSAVLAFLMASNLSTRIGRLSALASAISRAKSAQEITAIEQHISAVGGAHEIRVIAASIRRLSASIKFALMSSGQDGAN